MAMPDAGVDYGFLTCNNIPLMNPKVISRARLGAGSALSVVLLSGAYAVDVAGERLNSDAIRTRFGSYGVRVLEQDRQRRLASLFSSHEGGEITRTLALTKFTVPVAPALQVIDRDIRAGASLGATLREAGWQVIKSGAIECLGKAGGFFAGMAGDGVTPESPILLRAYGLSASRDDANIDYATIAEAYHPQHIAPPTQPACESVATNSESTDQRFTALTELLKAMHWQQSQLPEG
jgi:hypothetical protein